MFGKLFAGRKRERKIERLVRERSDIRIADAVNEIKRQCGYSMNYPWDGAGNHIVGDYRSGGAKFRGGLSYPPSGVTLDHARLRNNARGAYSTDSIQAKTIIDRLVDSIVAEGLRYESAPKVNILGISETDAEEWAKNVEERFDSWAMDKRQHRSEQTTWYQSHRENVLFQKRDGEVFMRFFYSDDSWLQSPLQFEYLDPSQICGDGYTSTSGINYGNDGIKRDSRGRESEYSVALAEIENDNYTYKLVNIPRVDSKGAVLMLHAFTKQYPGQLRGISELAHALQDVQDLSTYSIATIQKAIKQSQLVMYVKPSADNPASNPFEDILQDSTAGPAAQQFGSNPEPAPGAQNVTEESVNPVSCYRLPEAPFDIPGSTVVANLDKGEELKPGINTVPTDSYNKFVDSFCSYLAASLSIPLEVVLMKFSQNYSASRASLILFWRVCRIWQAEMAADLLNPTVEAWLTAEIAAGRVSAPGWQDPRMRAAWLNGNWVGPPMPNIDPQRTAKADEMYVRMGAQTLKRTAQDYNGSDAEANRAKLKREFEDLPPVPWDKQAPAKEEEGEEKEEDEA